MTERLDFFFLESHQLTGLVGTDTQQPGDDAVDVERGGVDAGLLLLLHYELYRT